MRQNLEQYPNELSQAEFDNFEGMFKKIQFISSSTENAQARFLPQWIQSLKDPIDTPEQHSEERPEGSKQEDKHFRPEETAVVLCNESLLLPLLHSIPDIKDLNVTMGFPLGQTPVYNLINAVTALHVNGYINDSSERYYHRYVLPILRHPLIRQISPEAEKLEIKLRATNSFRPLVRELLLDPILTTIFTPVVDPKGLANCLLELLRQQAQSAPISEEKAHSDAKAEPASEPSEYDPLNAEAVFRCFTLINRLSDLLQEGLIEVNIHTFQKLLQKVLSTATVPFSGEPVRGMQIMGMLETRNLDFKNVLMLSVNEGMLPKNGGETSFIPYNLRKGFGLTTSEHRDSIFAYYFFRLLQRAKNISLVYNTSTDGLNRGEMSRFMLQLLIEAPHTVEHFSLNSGIELTSPRYIQVEKTPELIQNLKNKYDFLTNKDASPFSPTALNSLIDCSLRFYFRYMAGLKEAEEISEEIDGATLGNFFHHSAEYIYTTILLKKGGMRYDAAAVEQAKKEKHSSKDFNLSGIIEAEDLDPWLKGIYSIEKVVDHFFRKDYFQISDERTTLEYNGEQLIKRKLIIDFLKTLLKLDKERAPFEIIALEKEVSENFEAETSVGKISLKLGGIIDRMDQKDNVLRILDYKTGGIPKSPESVDALFDDSAERASYILQIFLYAIIVQHSQLTKTITPQILYIHKAAQENYSPAIKIGLQKQKTEVEEILPYEKPFRNNLDVLLKALFEKDKPFLQTEIPEKCAYCDYKRICCR
jgi:RecB family exonuclease